MNPSHPTFDVVQDTSGVYKATLSDENHEALTDQNLDSISLTLYDNASDDIINGREDQSVLNDNGVTLDCDGVLTWDWEVDDMPDLHPTKKTELHTAVWKITWNGGDNQIIHEVSFRIHKIHTPS